MLCTQVQHMSVIFTMLYWKWKYGVCRCAHCALHVVVNLWKFIRCCDVHWGVVREDASHCRDFLFNTKWFNGAHCGVSIALRCNSFALSLALFHAVDLSEGTTSCRPLYSFSQLALQLMLAWKFLKQKHALVCIDENVLTWSAVCAAYVFVWVLCCSHPALVGTGSKVAIKASKQAIIVPVRPVNMPNFFFFPYQVPRILLIAVVQYLRSLVQRACDLVPQENLWWNTFQCYICFVYFSVQSMLWLKVVQKTVLSVCTTNIFYQIQHCMFHCSSLWMLCDGSALCLCVIGVHCVLGF